MVCVCWAGSQHYNHTLMQAHMYTGHEDRASPVVSSPKHPPSNQPLATSMFHTRTFPPTSQHCLFIGILFIHIIFILAFIFANIHPVYRLQMFCNYDSVL